MMISSIILEAAGQAPAWMRDAQCADPRYNPDDWFHASPEDGEDTYMTRESTKRAIAVCNFCPVRIECLNWAFRQHDDNWSIAGGLTHNQRTRLLRKLRERSELVTAS